MAILLNKDFQRKLRQGREEITISLSRKFVEKNKLKVGDLVDLRTLKKLIK